MASPNTLKLLPSRGRTILSLIICILFAAGGAVMIHGRAPMGWFVFLVFAFGIFMAIFRMNPKTTYLLLNEEGFTLASVFKKSLIPWSQIEQFKVSTLPSLSLFFRERKGVSYYFNASSPKYSSWGNSRRGLFGGTTRLYDSYGMSVEQLAALLNEWRQRYTTPDTLLDVSSIQQAQTTAQDKTFHPYATLTLIAFLALIFVAQILFAVRPWKELFQSDILTLEAMGGMQKDLVLEGGWYRLVTAAFLHADLIHILFNSIALILGGRLLEKFVGPWWTFLVFLLSALGGTCLGFLINPENLISVGASGGIMGMFAAALFCVWRLPTERRNAYMYPLLRVLIPSLIPLAMETSSGKVDYAAHFGGAIVGAMIGFFLLMTWSQDFSGPRFSRFAKVGSILGMLVVALCFFQVIKNYGMDSAEQAPRSEFQDRFLRSYQELKAGKAEEAEKKLLEELDDLKKFNPSTPADKLEATKVDAEIRSILFGSYLMQSRFQDALKISSSSCQSLAQLDELSDDTTKIRKVYSLLCETREKIFQEEEIPSAELPGENDPSPTIELNLVKKYPNDPRSHFLYASTLVEQKKDKQAEEELRTALTQDEILHDVSPDGKMEAHIRAMLAMVLAMGHRMAEAKEVVQPSCSFLNEFTAEEKELIRGFCPSQSKPKGSKADSANKISPTQGQP